VRRRRRPAGFGSGAADSTVWAYEKARSCVYAPVRLLPVLLRCPVSRSTSRRNQCPTSTSHPSPQLSRVAGSLDPLHWSAACCVLPAGRYKLPATRPQTLATGGQSQRRPPLFLARQGKTAGAFPAVGPRRPPETGNGHARGHLPAADAWGAAQRSAGGSRASNGPRHFGRNPPGISPNRGMAATASLPRSRDALMEPTARISGVSKDRHGKSPPHATGRELERWEGSPQFPRKTLFSSLHGKILRWNLTNLKY